MGKQVAVLVNCAALYLQIVLIAVGNRVAVADWVYVACLPREELPEQTEIVPKDLKIQPCSPIFTLTQVGTFERFWGLLASIFKKIRSVFIPKDTIFRFNEDFITKCCF